MEQHNFNKQHLLIDLVTKYEAMSQQGTVVFYEETVFSYLIDYYQNQEDYESALSVVDYALKQHCFSAFLYFKKAQLLSILCHESDLDQAMDALERAESLSPADLSIFLLKVQVLAKQQHLYEAFSILEKIKGNATMYKPKDLAEIYFCEGLLYEQMQEHDMMYEKWSRALMINTRHPEILQKMWTCIKRSNKFEECIYLFESIIDIDPYCHLAWFYLGHGLSYQNQYKKAIEAYEYAFVIDKEFEEAYKECAANCLILKDYGKALECYKEALMYIGQPESDLLFNIGQCYHYQGNTNAAFSFYEQAINLDEYYDEVYYHIGKCLVEQGKSNSAIYYFKKAISLDNQQEDYFSALALAYYHLEQFDKALTCFCKAAELTPDQQSFWVDYASFLLNINNAEEALQVLEDADEYSYGSELLYCKTVCLHKLGRQKEAIDVLAEALVENFERHSLLLDLAPEMGQSPTYNAVIQYYEGE